MEPLKHISGTLAVIDRVNIDTDMIIPKQFLSTVQRKGLSEGLFYELRHDMDGNRTGDFVLDRPDYKDAKIILSGANFGCGSSREHAPWALKDAGITCVIAPSFADIFYNNAAKNGIALIALPQEDCDRIRAQSRQEIMSLEIDLESRTLTLPGGDQISFDMPGAIQNRLLSGLDDIGETLKYESEIAAYEARAPQ